MNTEQRITAAMLPSMRGAWLMTSDRLNDFATRIRTAVAQPVALAGPMPEADAGYSVTGDVATIQVVGTLVKYGAPEDWMNEYLGLCPTTKLSEFLSRAMADNSVRSIVLEIDTGGGQVAGSTSFAEAVAAANKIKPIDARVSDNCHSAGTWIAAQCRSISANATAFCGSIGVVATLVDDAQFWANLGVKLVVVSSGGIKGAGMDGTVSPELVDDVKREITGLYDQFIAAVATGRKMSVEAVKALADGRSWIASEAKQKGLIDQIIGASSAPKPASAKPSGTYASKERGELVTIWRTGDATQKAEALAEMAQRSGESTANVQSVWDACFASPGETAAPASAPTTATISHGDKPMNYSEAKIIAGHEWDELPAVRVGWSDKDRFVAHRAQVLTGVVRVGGANPLPATPQVSTLPTVAEAEAEALASAEFDAAPKAHQDRWSSKRNFVSVRSRELAKGIGGTRIDGTKVDKPKPPCDSPEPLAGGPARPHTHGAADLKEWATACAEREADAMPQILEGFTSRKNFVTYRVLVLTGRHRA